MNIILLRKWADTALSIMELSLLGESLLRWLGTSLVVNGIQRSVVVLGLGSLRGLYNDVWRDTLLIRHSTLALRMSKKNRVVISTLIISRSILVGLNCIRRLLWSNHTAFIWHVTCWIMASLLLTRRMPVWQWKGKLISTGNRANIVLNHLVGVVTSRLDFLSTRIDGRCSISFDVRRSLGTLNWLRLRTLLNSTVGKTSWAGDVGCITFWPHFLVHLRQLSDNFVHALTFVELWLYITLPILLLDPLLWTTLCKFASTSRIVVLYIVIHATMFSTWLNCGFWTLNSNLLMDVVTESGVISLREEGILVTVDYADSTVVLHDFLLMLKWRRWSMGPLRMLYCCILLLLSMMWICLRRVSSIYYFCRIVGEARCGILLVWALRVLQVLLWAFPLLNFVSFVVEVVSNLRCLSSSGLSRWR